MALDRVRAGEVDVEFNALTGRFHSDVSAARRAYHDATDKMGDDAIRAAVAQDKLNRAIARYGPESNQAKEAGLRYRAALRAVETQEKETAAASTSTAHAIDRVGRESRQAERDVRGLRGGLFGLRGGVLAATAAIGITGGAVGFVAAARKALEVTSNLNEQTSKTEQVFGSAAGTVKAFAGDALGLATDKALEYASTIGLLFVNSGQTRDDAAKLSVSLVKLATDMASFNNTSVEEALNAIRSGLTGEIEPLRKFGVFLSEARTKTAALAATHKESASELTTGEKVLARYNLLLKDTTLTQGDYLRTIDGVANQEREAQKNIRNLEAQIGKGLTPAYHKALEVANEWLSNQENVDRVAGAVEGTMGAVADAAHGVYDAFKLIHAVTGPIVDGLGGIDQAAKAFVILGALAKLKLFAGGFGLIRTQSALTRTAVVADTAAMATAAEANATRMTAAGTRMAAALRGLVGKGIAAYLLYPAAKSAFEEATGVRGLGPLSPSDVFAAPDAMSSPSQREFWARVAAAPQYDFGVNFGGGPAGNPYGPAPSVFSGAAPTTMPAKESIDVGFDLELSRAETDTAKLALLVRRREFLERAVARFQRKGFAKAELKFRGELETVKGGIQGIYGDRAAAAAARKADRDAAEAKAKADEAARKAKKKADDDAAEAKAKADREAARLERDAKRRAAIALARTKAEGTSTLRDDIAAVGLELRYVRELKRQTDKGTSAWLELRDAEERLEQEKAGLETTRAKNVAAAAQRAQARRVREAAERLGITYAGPGAGGPVLKTDKAAEIPGLTLRDFQMLRSSFFSEFSSDVFTRGDSGLAPGSQPLVQHLHFHAEKDMLAAAREARDAVAHTWSGA